MKTTQMSWFKQARQLYRWRAPWLMLALLISMCTGFTYRLARNWAGICHK
ncbi:MAG TPA: hypothetical protein ACN46Y_05810 [Prochlorococcus sp.]